MREGRALRRRPGVPRPRGRLRARGQGGRAATAVAALTEQDWGDTAERSESTDSTPRGATATSSKSSPGAPRRARRDHRAEGAQRHATFGGSTSLLTQLETKLGLGRRIRLEVLIEEAEGLANVAEIARASGRLEALIFGAGDLSASLRARVDGNFDPVGEYPGDFWHFARVQVVAAARAAGIDAIDAPYPGLPGPRRLPRGGDARAACSASTASGPSTPARSPIANEVFTPDGGRGRRGPRHHRRLPSRGGRRSGRDRARRQVGRRGDDAPRGERVAQGGAQLVNHVTAAAIAAAERSMSAFVVAQFEIDTRSTYSPFHVVPPSQHVPSRWIAAIAARAASSPPGSRTRT